METAYPHVVAPDICNNDAYLCKYVLKEEVDVDFTDFFVNKLVYQLIFNTFWNLEIFAREMMMNKSALGPRLRFVEGALL
jgi:hypothetical protein